MMHKPLLQKGTHELTVEEMYEVCVQAFAPSNSRREHLFVQFTDFLIFFRGLGFMPAEIWIDGSFLTTKPDPGDIDLLIIVHMGEVNQLPREVQNLLYTEFGGGPSKKRFECEALIAPSADAELIESHLKFFCNLNAGNTFKKKGIIKLKL